MSDTDEIREAYDFPDSFRLADAAHMDRVEAADGTPFRVLVSPAGSRRELVHEDVAVYAGVHDHPMTTGVIGMTIVAGTLLALLGATYQVALIAPGLWKLIIAAAGPVAGLYLSNFLLYRTLLHDWVFRFLEWNEHKELILLKRGESA